MFALHSTPVPRAACIEATGSDLLEIELLLRRHVPKPIGVQDANAFAAFYSQLARQMLRDDGVPRMALHEICRVDIEIDAALVVSRALISALRTLPFQGGDHAQLLCALEIFSEAVSVAGGDYQSGARSDRILKRTLH